jgi:predicted ester cyclase
LSTTASANKAVIRRLVDEVMNAGWMEAIDELYSPAAAKRARRWIAPLRRSFPDVHMEIVDLVAEGEKVAARFICTGTHLGDWCRHGPTRRRFALTRSTSSNSPTGASRLHGASKTPTGASSSWVLST